jgi:hypothetical protein
LCPTNPPFVINYDVFDITFFKQTVSIQGIESIVFIQILPLELEANHSVFPSKTILEISLELKNLVGKNIVVLDQSKFIRDKIKISVHPSK